MTTRRIPEIIVEGKRLGRHIRHDDRSLAYLHPETDTIVSVQWERVIPVLDQGNVGSCTGNACTGILGTLPDDADLSALIAAGLVLDENEALSLYSAAETIDGDGPYPPNDNGSSGLSVAQAAKNAGLCSGYLHALSVAAAHSAIQAGPFMVGSDWYDSFDTPDANGLVAIAPGATVRGGHEYECIGYDAPSDLWHFVNSWGTSYGVAGHFYYSSDTFATLLASDGDVTSLVPLSQPAPTPTPTPTPDPTPAPEGFIQRLEHVAEEIEQDVIDAIHGLEQDLATEGPESPETDEAVQSPSGATSPAPEEAETPEEGAGASSGAPPVDKNAVALETQWLQAFEQRLRGILALILTRTKPEALIEEAKTLVADFEKWV
jgi:hypothetical protein